MLGISEAAEQIGFRTLAAKVGYEALIEDAPFPAILHWNQKHFVVVLEQKFEKDKITIADPAHGIVQVDKETFLRSWMGSSNMGVALLLEPTQRFYEEKDEMTKTTGFIFFIQLSKTI